MSKEQFIQEFLRSLKGIDFAEEFDELVVPLSDLETDLRNFLSTRAEWMIINSNEDNCE